jgi:two-component system response regulator AtoC
MPVGLQAKLLHVLQDSAFTRVGSNRPVDVDVRVIAATNRDLEAMMRDGSFREDLYYRLQVIEIRIPPLRERREEIPALVEFFLAKYAGVYRRRTVKPSHALLDALYRYSWPGNIRQLENMMKRFVVLQDESLILAELDRLRQEDSAQAPKAPAAAVAAAPTTAEATAPAAAPDAPAGSLPPSPSLADFEDAEGGIQLAELARAAAMQAEREAIQRALARFRWNRRKAATYLNVSYKTLLNKMRECGISEAGAP